MMDRLRSLLRTIGVTALLTCALSLAGPGTSHARPSNASQSVHGNGLPCNAACKAYMSWAHRVTAMFHPSRPVKMFRPIRPLRTTAVHHGRPLPMMAHHARGTRQRVLNSFAQVPVPSDATPQSVETPQASETPRAETPQAAPTEKSQAVETPQAEVALSKPMDKIADRFPAAAEFMMARRVGADIASKDAADSAIAAGADTTSAARATSTVGSSARTDMRLIAALLLALCTLPTLLFFMEVDRQARRGPRARSALGA
jgi:hypothetical protein